MPTGDDLRDELASDELSLLALGVPKIPHAEIDERGRLLLVELPVFRLELPMLLAALSV